MSRMSPGALVTGTRFPAGALNAVQIELQAVTDSKRSSLMKSLYARFVLMLIRPALLAHADEEFRAAEAADPMWAALNRRRQAALDRLVAELRRNSASAEHMDSSR